MQIPEKNNYFKLQTPLTQGEVGYYLISSEISFSNLFFKVEEKPL